MKESGSEMGAPIQDLGGDALGSYLEESRHSTPPKL